MPALSDVHFHVPSSWEDTETLICDLLGREWRDRNVQKNGSRGQGQNGVDIFGMLDGNGAHVGAQVKTVGRPSEKTTTVKELKDEVDKAKSFRPPLSEYLFITTGPSDVKLQEAARKITEEHAREGLFSVHSWGWAEVERRLASYPDLIKKHYPDHIVDPQSPSVTIIPHVVQNGSKILVSVRNDGENAIKFRGFMHAIFSASKWEHRIPYSVKWSNSNSDGWCQVAPGETAQLEIAQAVSSNSDSEDRVFKFLRAEGSSRENDKFTWTVSWGGKVEFDLEILSESRISPAQRHRFRLSLAHDGELSSLEIIEQE